jgi:formylglycine-generating enzyme required for sulfatase activity
MRSFKIPVREPHERGSTLCRFLAGCVLVAACVLGLSAAGLSGTAWAQAAPALGKRVALVIGNSAYATSPLANPVNDATDMAAKLKSLGFEVVTLLNADRTRMLRGIDEFGRTAAQADAALVYYAGHGMQIDGNNFLLPTGRAFDTEQDVKDDAISVTRLQETLDIAAPKLRILILDACRDAPLRRRSRSAQRGLARVDVPAGTNALVAFSAAAGETAADGTGRNGTFTKHLLELIDTPGQSLIELFMEVRKRVEAETRKSQSPEELNRLTTNFYFRPVPAAVAATAVAPAAAAATAPTDEEEQAAWRFCERTQSLWHCEFYLKTWPQGKYVRLARSLVIGLQSAAGPMAGAPPPPQPTATAPPPAALPGSTPNVQSPAQSVPSSSPQTGPQTTLGQVLRECPVCPELVVIPAGRFTMGSPPDEAERDPDEGPQRQVSIARFALGRMEVTQGQWRAVMGSNPSRHHQCGDDCPVDNVSHADIQLYLQRLQLLHQVRYRLPSEAEWEYAARAGSSTPFSTGRSISTDQANFNGNATYGGSAKGINRGRSTKGCSFAPNGFGLCDMHGNLIEWVEDVLHPNHAGAPADGAARTMGGDASKRVQRGGSWMDAPRMLRSAARNYSEANQRFPVTGFRVAKSLP